MTFFEAGKTYRHGNGRGSEGLFDVRYVGTAPGPFEHHSETLGVAFGWLWGPGPDGTWQGLGSYSTPDFADWEEIPLPPCGAQADDVDGVVAVCAITKLPGTHTKHVAADGRYWWELEPCKHDSCTSFDCDGDPTVRCGNRNEAGADCFLLAGHTPRTDHAYLEQP